MNKRKQIGIIKYGKRHNTAKKMQSGGTIYAQTGGYNWREDPYEMMLLRQRLAADEMRSRERRAAIIANRSSRGAKSSGKPPTLKPFAALKGGLKATRDHLNILFSNKQSVYVSNIEKYGQEWIATPEAQQMHSNIVASGIEYEQILAAELKSFDEAKKTLKDQDDKDTYAISNRGRIYVYNTENNVHEDIDLSEYTGSMNKYHPMTKRELALDITNRFSEKNSMYISDFLGGGAYGKNTMENTYIAINRDKVSYMIKKDIQDNILGVGAIGTNDSYIPMNEWKELLYNYAGGEGKLTTAQYEKHGTDLKKIIENVYNGVFNNSEHQSGLLASLQSQVLKNVVNLKNLSVITNKQKRDEAMHKMVQVELVNKFFGEVTKSKTTENSGSSPKIKSDGIIAALMVKTNSSGTDNSKYVIEKNGRVSFNHTGDVKVDSVSLPMVYNILSSAKLGFPSSLDDIPPGDMAKIKQQATLTGNDVISDIKANDKIFLGNGLPISSMYGSQSSVNNFIIEATSIDPGSNLNMVFMPADDKGNPIPRIVSELNKYKKDFVKDAIIKYNTINEGSEKILTTDPELLLPGNRRAKDIDSDIKKYNEFINMGHNFKRFKAEHEKNPSDKTQRALDLATASKEMQDAFGNTLTNGLKGASNIRLKPFAVVSTLVDADYKVGGDRLEDNLKMMDKRVGYGNSSLLLRSAESYQETFMKDLGKETNRIGFGDETKVIDLLIPIKNVTIRNAEEGGSLVEGVHLNNIENGITKLFEQNFVLTTNSTAEVTRFLKI